MQPRFEPGTNIAIMMPSRDDGRTVAFYRDVLMLEACPAPKQPLPGSECFAFGGKRLWVDRTTPVERAEIWPEIRTGDADTAAAHLKRHHITRCDEVETLPAGFRGFWVRSPGRDRPPER